MSHTATDQRLRLPEVMSSMLLRDIFVCGVSSSVLGERLLAEDATKLTFETAIQMAESFERAQADWRSVGADRRDGDAAERVVAALTHGRKGTEAAQPGGSRRGGFHQHGRGDSSRHGDTRRSGSLAPKEKTCFRCAQAGHLANDSQCPAIHQQCRKCGKTGHFAAACRAKVVNAIQGTVEHEYNLFAMEGIN